MDKTYSALESLFGDTAFQVNPLSATNNQVFTVDKYKNGQFILKRFERENYAAYEREQQMRACLQAHSEIAFPAVLATIERDDYYYILMEQVKGVPLLDLWRGDPAQTLRQLPRLGETLAALHQIPLTVVEGYLGREELLYSEKYFQDMLRVIASYLPSVSLLPLLEKCYQVIDEAELEETITHGDFGLHQIIVGEDGIWNLMDFEYTAISTFADDLSGTEVRLEYQYQFDPKPFLLGYFAVRSLRAAYVPVAMAYKAYSLLSILSYRISKQNYTPTLREIDQLSVYLENL